MMTSEGKWAAFILLLIIFLLYLFPSWMTLIFAYTLLLGFPSYALRKWASTLSRKAQNALGAMGLIIAAGAVYGVYAESLGNGSTIEIKYFTLLTLALIGGSLGSLPFGNLVVWLKSRFILTNT